MKKIKFWLIKKLIGNTPVIMNVTLMSEGVMSINGAESEGIFEKWFVINKDDSQNDEVKA